MAGAEKLWPYNFCYDTHEENIASGRYGYTDRARLFWRWS